jgi:predicted AlkP superfamily phosphohydrolase/phosphomutase/tetratricopeptide (TPR) repeat protein
MSDSKRVLLVGWDAADWKIILPLIDAGHMPATRRLVEEGVMGNLATLTPVLSPMLWTSIATGKRPFKHGIYGFTEPTPDRKAVQPMTNLSRKCKAVWNILNQKGMQSIVVGWWPSHPAEPINGVTVSDYYNKAPRRPGQAWNLMPGTIHPKRCLDELTDLRIHPDELVPEQVLPFIPDAKEVDQETDARLSSVMRMICECTSVHSAATHLMETEPWDFMAVYYDAIDHFCHGFMRYHPPKQDHVSDEDFKLYRNVVTAAYVYHDMMLGRLLEFAGDETTVILMSDHGFHPDHLRPRMLSVEPAGPAEEHRNYGIFLISGPGIKKDHIIHGANLLDVTPTILTIYGLPVGDDMDGRPLVDAFEREPAIETIDSWEAVPGEDGQHPEGAALDPAESKEALEQLIALGYIERPDRDSTKAVANCTRELDYNLARAYMDAGMFGEAIPLLAKLYSTFPLEFRFGVQLANCLNAMGRVGDMERLIDDLNSRWRVARDEARARLREVAKVARKRGEQWKEFRKIDEENKDDPSKRPKLARMSPSGRPILFGENEQLMIRKLRAVARGNPQTLDFLAATVAVSKGDFQGALQRLQQAELTESRNPMFQFHVGNVYLALDRLDDAERAYTRALEFDEFHPNALMGLCRTHLERDDYARACEYGREAVGLKYHYPAAHYFLGLAKETTADIDGAVASYDVALAQNPNFPEAHERLAEIFTTVRVDENRSWEHREAARGLRRAAEEISGSWEPIDLPPFDAARLRDELPMVSAEELENTEGFKRCLAQAPTRSAAGNGSQEREAVTIVSGLPRSGTSMMMQMLRAAGIEAYADEERQPDESNPKGYYESALVKKLPHRNDWLNECDGRALKVVVQLIPYLPQDVDYRVIFMEREMDEILESQDKMLERLDRQGAKLENERLAHVFDQQTRLTLSLIALHKLPLLTVRYEDAISDPAGTAARVAEFLGADLDVPAMAAAVDPALYRQRVAQKA